MIYFSRRYPIKTVEQIKRFEALNIPIILFTDEVFPFANKAKYLFTIPLYGAATSIVFPQALIMIIMQEIFSRVILNDPKLAKERVAKFEESAKGKYFNIEELID